MTESWNDMLVGPGRVDLPTEPANLFGREAPLAVEIGFGSGRFLEWICEERPGWNLLGAEISPASLARSYRRLREGEYRNVRLFKGTGEFLVREVLPRASVRRVFVNFPDPWPKARHEGRRLLAAQFFRTLAGRLERGGELRLTTDHADHYEWVLDEASAVDCYEVREDQPPLAFVETRYGEKWRREGKEIRHVVFERVGEAPWVPREIERRETMHHATIEGTLPDAIDDVELDPRRIEGGVAAVTDVYERLGDREILVLVHVQEPDLTQRILIEVAPGGEEGQEKLTVRIRRFNEPLMTGGTSAAVEHVAEWVASLRPENEIVARQY